MLSSHIITLRSVRTMPNLLGVQIFKKCPQFSVDDAEEENGCPYQHTHTHTHRQNRAAHRTQRDIARAATESPYVAEIVTEVTSRTQSSAFYTTRIPVRHCCRRLSQ